jgi:TetR/AcrR family transcriptional regulator, transcriptional repressor for nem operon
MPRPREFEELAALDRAMQVFWKRGFENTSMDELVKATGVHRGSIYTTFGDKQALFLKSLDRYLNLERTQLTALLQAAPSKLTVIRSILEGIAEDSARKNSRGCFMVNSIVERAPHDSETRARAHDCLTRLSKVFEAALTQAQRTGELGKDVNVSALAIFLVNTVQGMRVLGRAGVSRRQLLASVDIAMKVFE